ncbi:MAG: hypothetical protein OSW71_12325, partial [Proteobacteria bacterium]|nr:hypothetical protein [Pseudomonadota bacterium]
MHLDRGPIRPIFAGIGEQVDQRLLGAADIRLHPGRRRRHLQIDALAAIPGAKVERPKAYASGTAIYLHVLQSPDAFGRFVAALDDLLRSLNAQ